MKRLTSAAFVAALLALSACGDTFEEQALIGAGAGAATAAAYDGDLAEGALIGAAANVLACNTGRFDCR